MLDTVFQSIHNMSKYPSHSFLEVHWYSDMLIRKWSLELRSKVEKRFAAGCDEGEWAVLLAEMQVDPVHQRS